MSFAALSPSRPAHETLTDSYRRIISLRQCWCFTGPLEVILWISDITLYSGDNSAGNLTGDIRQPEFATLKAECQSFVFQTQQVQQRGV